jgi:membrane dipeptidase
MNRERDNNELSALHEAATVFLGYMNPGLVYLPDGRIDATLFFRGHPCLQGSLPRLRKGGVDVATLSFGVNDPDLFPGHAGICRLLQSLGAFLAGMRGHSGDLELATSVADVRRINRAGKMAVLLHLTGAYLDGRIDLLHVYHGLGVRSIHTPFDTVANARADAYEKGEGLTPFARDVLAEMGRLHIVVDLAHASDAMFQDVLRCVKGPVIVSHGMCRAISDTPRNLTDDQIRAVAGRGGVVGIHFAAQLIDDTFRQRINASEFYEELRRWQADMKRRYPDPSEYCARRYDWDAWIKTRAYRLQQSVAVPALDRVIQHVDRMVELAGIEHVGVGADYDLGTIPRALDHAAKLPNLTAALRRRGYSPAEIRKLWGDNLMRVYRQVLGQ